MIWERCYIQTFRLFFDYSKYNINSKGRGINFIEFNINTALFSTKQPSSTYTFINKKMSSISSNLEKKQYQNKLVFEKSPYLLQHATNPVNWYPWGDEALEKAKQEDKLIFLSVGYSTCHWCHVMEKESFENPDIAKIMNENFINIKVDREERPDIDKVYMIFVQSMTGQGGWPMSVFLMPITLIPIAGGTYFPPVDGYGRIGFKKLLEAIATKWTQNKEGLITAGSKVLEVLQLEVQPNNEGSNTPTLKCADTCVKQLIDAYDSINGGFQFAPKFPLASNFNFLFSMYTRDPTGEIGKECLEMCLYTLTKMANGGIHDHVGQGFARYSTDNRWHVPHFEKMLYDQAQLLRTYSDAYLASNDIFFAEVVDDIITYVIRELYHPEGGFFSAEDADSLPTFDDTEKKEGAFYVWKYEEIQSLLAQKSTDKENVTLFDIFCHHFDVKPNGNVQPKQDSDEEFKNENVLIVYGSIAKTAEHFKISIDNVKSHLKESLNILFEERKKRPRPHVDDKILTSWNGLMISGLSRAASALDNPKYAKYAENTAKFIERYLYDQKNKVLLRSCYRDKENKIQQPSVPINGFQVDYAFVIQGLLDLYKVTFDSHWIELAEELQDIQDSLFWDAENGGYYLISKNDDSLILRIKDEQDNAEPSGNSVACGNLIKLASYLHRTDFSDKAGQIINANRSMLLKLPVACTELVAHLVNFVDSLTQIYIIGKKENEDTKNLLRVVQTKLLPGKIVMLTDGEDHNNILYKKNKVIDKMTQQKGLATAYVCHNHVCSLPVTDPQELEALLDKNKNKH